MRTAPELQPLPEGSARARRRELVAQEQVLRQKIRDCDHCAKLREEAGRLAAEADGLISACVAEARGEEGGVTAKKVTFKSKEAEDGSVGARILGASETAERETTTRCPTNVPASHVRKRNCGLCHSSEPYPHRAKNCPNAHKVRERDVAEKSTRKVKKTRGPVSPERRAQLAESLKKARAAKGGKK